MPTDFYDAPNNRYIDEATGLVDPNPSGLTISQARPDANLPGYSYIPGTSASSDPAALAQQYGTTPVQDAAGLYQLPDSVLNKFSGEGSGIKGFLNGPGAVLLPVGIGAAGVALGAAGAAGAGGGGTAIDFAGLGAGEAGMSGAGVGAGVGGSSAADLLGLQQMAADAGLTGDAAEAFVNSGGTLGSTAMGGGGVGTGVAGGAGNTPLDPTIGGAAPGVSGPSFLPDLGTGAMQPLGTAAQNFGISAPAAASGPVVPGFNPLDPTTFSGATGGGGFAGATDIATNAATSTAEEVMKKLKEGGGTAMDWIAKNPASAAMLGLSAANALSKPKLPEAAQAVQKANTPNLATASGVVNSGGSTGPAWNTQKAAIDSAIDRQIAEKRQQILQQAQNSGMGVDSLVTVQQIQKMQEQMEGLRQQQYMQAQQQNVQAALSEMGMSNQALSGVAGQQFATSKEAQTSAAQTAQLALMLQQLQKPTANQGATANA
jgi:hypothetical protein